MSVVGVGTDIVAVERMESLLSHHGERFLARCFTAVERDLLRQRHKSRLAASVAARWAAKEAFLKALGGSIAHIPYHEISIESETGGAPSIRLEGMAARAMAERGGNRIHVSLSHESRHAVATVLIET